MNLDHLSKKQKAIAKAAEELFWRFGFKKITIEDICKKAETSKMTFYKYFPNKNQLIKFLLNTWYKEGMAKFREIEQTETNFQEKFKKLLQLKAESTAKVSKEFAKDYYFSNPEIKEFIEEIYQKGLAEFMDFITRAQQKGEVRKNMKPEFFLAVLKQMQELVNNDELILLYPNYQDFILEFNNFVFYGLLPKDEN